VIRRVAGRLNIPDSGSLASNSRVSHNPQGNLKYFGQVSAREGMVRYFELKSPASHERMYWYLIDPFYDPFGKTPGLYISLNLAGLPTAGPMLLSRHRLPIKWVEEHLDSQILQINPFSGEESLSEQEIMN
jgi:hypothetical protein